MSTRITACIVTYRSDLTDVSHAVQSLKVCTLPIEIIVVDNDSGGNYRAALNDRLAAFSNVKIVNSGGNRGFGAGHNFGFNAVAAHSDIHLVVNPDILVHKNAVETLIEYLNTHPDVGMAAPKVVDRQGTVQYLCKRYPSVLALFGRRFMPGYLLKKPCMVQFMDRYHMRDKDYNQVMEPECISGCFMAFRSNIFKQLGGFDKTFFLYFEDNDITLRARKICKAVYVPEAVVTHAWKGGARQSGKLTWLQIQSAIKFYRKWGWKLY